MKKIVISIFYSLLLLSPLNGLDFGGSLEVDYYGSIDPSTFYQSERVRLTLVSELAARTESRFFDFYLSGLLYLQPVGEPLLIDPERIVREAYLGLHFSIFDIYLGRKFVNWGKVDVLSPLNVINHSDTTVLSIDSLEGPLPDILAQLRVYFSDSIHLEMVYVPFLQPNIYSIEEVYIDSELVLDLSPLEKQIYDIDASFINTEIKLFSEWAHSIHAAAHYTSFIFDLIATYSFYLDPFLDVDLSDLKEEIVDEGTAERHVLTGAAFPAYNRTHNFGMGVSFYLRDLLVSGDSALKLTQDFGGSRMEIKNSELFSVIQIERLFRKRGRLQLNLFHKFVFNYDAQLQSDYSPFVRDYINAVIDDYLLQKDQSQLYFLAHLDTHFFRERLLLGANIIYGYTEKGYYLIPRITYKLSDYLTLSSGADIWIKGKAEGFIGRNETRDNFFIRMQLAW